MSRLRVVVDGEPLPEDQARATWERFSAHMDEHQGDFAGFAAAEGFREASVAVAGSTPTLTLSTKPAGTHAPPPRSARGGGERRERRHPAKRRPAPQRDVGGDVPRRRKR